MSLYSGGIGEFVRTTTSLGGNNMFATYLRLQSGADGKALEAKLPAFVEKYVAPDLKERATAKSISSVPHGCHLSDEAKPNRGRAARHTCTFWLHCAVYAADCVCQFYEPLHRPVGAAGKRGRCTQVGGRQSEQSAQAVFGRIHADFTGILRPGAGFGLWALPFFNELTEQLSCVRNPLLFSGFLGWLC